MVLNEVVQNINRVPNTKRPFVSFLNFKIFHTFLQNFFFDCIIHYKNANIIKQMYQIFKVHIVNSANLKILLLLKQSHLLNGSQLQSQTAIRIKHQYFLRKSHFFIHILDLLLVFINKQVSLPKHPAKQTRYIQLLTCILC